MITNRFASTAATSAGKAPGRKIVLVGTGFLASYIVRSLIADPKNSVLLVSRNPQNLYDKVSHLGKQILPPKSYDLTSSDTVPLREALQGADAVVSMVGLLVASEQKMIDVQQKGAEKVALAAKEEGVGRTVLISAIGADPGGVTPYQRTKAAAESIFLKANPKATIIRPSIVFGPGDSFFTRFATLAKWLPFLPVFGGGVVRFQPVYAGDVARAIEICCRDDAKTVETVGGKVIEAGGPDVFTYKEIMQLVLKHTGLQGRRLILSLPYWVGMIQGFFLEKLPETMFTVTRDQVKQLRNDNVVTASSPPPLNGLDFEELLASFPSALPSSAPPGDAGLTSVHKSLPTYLAPAGSVESGKRTHGRGAATGLEEVRRMTDKSKKA